MAHVNGRQPNRHRGVPAHRLNQHALARGRRNLLADGGSLFRIVTVQMRSAEISGLRRATVCWSIVSFATMFKSCLGVRVRLRGQKRVPRPPARMMACVVSFSIARRFPLQSKTVFAISCQE